MTDLPAPTPPMKITMPPLEIETPRLKLVRPNKELAQAMFDAVQADRERLARFLPWVEDPKTVADEEKYIAGVHEEWAKQETFAWTMFTKDRQEFIGNIDIHAVITKNLRGEIGYWCVSRFEGQGLVSEAVGAIEKVLFECGLHRIAIHCSTHNDRSAGVAKRLGYQHEGSMKEDSFIGGVWHSTHIYSKINPANRS